MLSVVALLGNEDSRIQFQKAYVKYKRGKQICRGQDQQMHPQTKDKQLQLTLQTLHFSRRVTESWWRYTEQHLPLVIALH